MWLQRPLPVTLLTFMALCNPMTHASNTPMDPQGALESRGATHPPVVPEGGLLPLRGGVDALASVAVGEDGRVVMAGTGRGYLASTSHLVTNRQSELGKMLLFFNIILIFCFSFYSHYLVIFYFLFLFSLFRIFICLVIICCVDFLSWTKCFF